MYNNNNNGKSVNFVPKAHYVKPHNVTSYARKDGTFVHGYYRDGDGDTSINRRTDYLMKHNLQSFIM